MKKLPHVTPANSPLKTGSSPGAFEYLPQGWIVVEHEVSCVRTSDKLSQARMALCLFAKPLRDPYRDLPANGDEQRFCQQHSDLHIPGKGEVWIVEEKSSLNVFSHLKCSQVRR